MKTVSENDLQSLDYVVVGAYKYANPSDGLRIIADIRAELLALRNVADAALSLVQKAWVAGESRDKWEEILSALRLAGL